MANRPKRIVILGSTGSIGVQTLDVIESHPDSFEIVALAANKDWELLASQADKFRPALAALANQSEMENFKNAVTVPEVELVSGQSAVSDLASLPDIDLVVNAVVGFAGLGATLAAVKTGNRLALANKESLVAGGELVTKAAAETKTEIIPVDSEHSAIFQCLKAGRRSEIKRLILTASGGPFLDKPLDEFDAITPQEALKHPNWDMGRKVTIDSATMINKALEIIEAHWLFGVNPDRIDVMIHPQSIVHSMVEFFDSSVIAQMSRPDMRLPIRYALFYPDREPGTDGRIDFSQLPGLTFLEPDRERFPALEIAYRALGMGGTAGTILNAANEMAVDAFLEGRIGFGMITEIVQQSLEHIEVKQHPDIDDIVRSDRQAREYAADLVGTPN
ncbi:MAG: 1-deoxy-D-xylulose-5-phosphate reductoisomerase [candidate division Zixibacteria bacterium]|nr:1-deoxy-D-xylulose-5-phosphate reductoisomerase [candidate division Zixibacteria bacterium]